MHEIREVESGFTMKKMVDAFALVCGPIAVVIYPCVGLYTAYKQIYNGKSCGDS